MAVSSGFFFSVYTVAVLPACFLLGRSAPVYRLFLLFSSINRFSSYRLIASLLARFALVRQRNCFCFYSRQFLFSPSIVYALLLARSASVRRLFLLFSSIYSFSSRRFIASLLASFALVRRLFLLFWSPVPLQSVDCFCSSSRPFSFSSSIVYAFLVY